LGDLLALLITVFAISISWTVISRLAHCHHLLAALLAEAHLNQSCLSISLLRDVLYRANLLGHLLLSDSADSSGDTHTFLLFANLDTFEANRRAFWLVEGRNANLGLQRLLLDAAVVSWLLGLVVGGGRVAWT